MLSTYPRVRDINFEIYRPIRAGVIIYTIWKHKNSNETQYLYCFGVDSIHKELTDFGGGISYKKDRDALDGACREFNEESLGVFGNVTSDELFDCPVIYNQTMMIVFLKRDICPSIVDGQFYDRLSLYKRHEICGLEWILTEELNEIIIYGTSIRGMKMYDKVRYLLNSI